MPFKEGPRRAEKDAEGNSTYTCTWEGESPPRFRKIHPSYVFFVFLDVDVYHPGMKGCPLDPKGPKWIDVTCDDGTGLIGRV